MALTQITTDQAPRPAGAYSQAIVAGDLVFTAGAGPHDPHTGELAGETIEEQTAQVMRNLSEVLKAAGVGFTDVVKVTVHLQHLHRDFAGFNATYETFMSAPYPVRTTVGSELANILVEIDLVAVRS